MYFVDNGSAVPVMPQVKPVSSATPQFFTEGGNGTPPTYPGPDWFNIFQLELLNVLKEAQINPDKANHTQLVTAMKKLFLDASSNGSDIPDKAAFLSNLGLGEGSALPVGVPFPWPLATPPTGCMKCNGAPFSAEEYPGLAKAYPTNKLPDLRGEFIRGWDDGRGVDAERSILTAQEDMIKSHEHSVWRRGDNEKVTQSLNIDDPGRKYLSVVHSDSVVEGRDVDSLYAVPTGGSETRPRNIAFNYIVRAA